MVFFFFNDTATTEIYTLSLHDALPICLQAADAAEDLQPVADVIVHPRRVVVIVEVQLDRKSTRLNSSHLVISYAVFCLKKKSPHDNGRQRLRERARNYRLCPRLPRVQH